MNRLSGEFRGRKLSEAREKQRLMVHSEGKEKGKLGDTKSQILASSS